MQAMKMEITKNKECVEAAEYLLAQIRNSELTNDPVRRCAALYMLKVTFERSALPCLVEELYRLDILSTLTEILSRKYDPMDQKNNRSLYSLAADLLYQLSCLSSEQQVDTFYTKNILNTLCNLIDTAGDFFRFSPAFQNQLVDLIRQKPLANQRVCPVSVTKEVWKDMLRDCPRMFLYGSVTKVYDCHLYIMPVDNNDKEYLPQKVSVAQRLINAKLAWKFSNPKMKMGPLFETVGEFLHPGNHKTAEEDELLETVEKVQQSEAFEDLWVLDLIGGRYFWAYVGHGSLKIVDSFTELLAKELPSLILAESPQVGNLVVVENLDQTDNENCGGTRKVPGVFRGRIIAISDEQVTLFALDYGTVVTVKKCTLRLLQGATNPLLKTQSLVQVCRLSGVQATPVDDDALERSICVLVNLTRFLSDSAGGQILRKYHQLLYPLLVSAPPSVQLQVTKLLSNLAVCRNQPLTSSWDHLIRPLLSILARLSHKTEEGAVHKSLMLACLCILNNLVLMKAEYMEHYFELQGNIIILNILNNFRLSQKIVNASARVLRSAYPELQPVINYRQTRCKKERHLGLLPASKALRATETDLYRDSDDGWEEGLLLPNFQQVRSRTKQGKKCPRQNSARKSPEPAGSPGSGPLHRPRLPSQSTLGSPPEEPKQTCRKAVPEFAPKACSEEYGYVQPKPHSSPLSSSSSSALLSSSSSSSSFVPAAGQCEDSFAPKSPSAKSPLSSLSLFRLKNLSAPPQQNTEESKGSGDGRNVSPAAPTQVQANEMAADINQRVVTRNSSCSSTDYEGNSDSGLLLHNTASLYPDYAVSSTDSEPLLPAIETIETAADVEHFTPIDVLKAYEENSARNLNAKYIYDSYVDLRDGPNCHLLFFQDIKLVRTRTLSELICAFMNATGGTIYMGIDKYGCVRGVRLNRAERDSVRLSMDRIVRAANPNFLHNQIQLEYQPVYQQIGLDPLPCTDLWIIEISLRAPKEFQCYSILDKSLDKYLCYMRFGQSNHLMKENDVRELVVSEAEQTYLKKLARLQQRLQELDGHIKMLEEKNQ